MTTNRRAFSELITQLHESTGLSWSQLAKLFGVGARAVHGWANGAPANSPHEALGMALGEQVLQLDGTPDEVKAALFAPRPGASNLYTDFIRARVAAQGPDIHWVPGQWWQSDAALARRDEETHDA